MAKALTTQQIRDSFTGFFSDREHRRVPSSPIVPADDPTLLFTSAGMVQFKPLYAATGALEYTRATTVQKCFRATDLEQVGRTPRHLCFFEMLGNFSFGDYFKKEAIAWAWEYITQVLEMEVNQLWVTVYKDDDEAEALWQETGVSLDRIVRLGDEDNFWGPAGSSGACGPSSEIYWDLGEPFGCGAKGCKPGCECDRFQEFWNLVFPQFHQAEDGNRTELPKKGIDTGMGLERLAQLLQGKASVFETDEFAPLKQAVLELTDVDDRDAEQTTSLNIIMEHARAVTMLFHEGVYPGNEGRGYVARRILRRAMRRGLLLGLKEPFLYRLTGRAIDILSPAYPELLESRERIARICKAEETRFLETLETGIKKFNEVVTSAKDSNTELISGREAFTLYDTYGFPLDMTAEMALEQGLQVDADGFAEAMEEQVARSRASAKFEQAEEDLPWEWIEKDLDHSHFEGYRHLELQVRVVAKRARGREWELLLDKTPFYAEGGGQVADMGTIEGSDLMFEVVSVKKTGGFHVHRGVLKHGTIGRGPYQAGVDESARRATERNHTGTHLLNAALRRVLGDHVTQAGSLVAPDRLRFDFHHFAPLTRAQIEAIEEDVNTAVLQDFAVEKEETSMEEARRAGAVAMFGEKYGERVRQVYVMDEEASDVTRELCGGCHVRRTGEIGLFRIISEESVGAGVRRVEATTGFNGLLHSQGEDALLGRIEQAVKVGSRSELESKVQSLVDENDQLKRELTKLKGQSLSQAASELADHVTDVLGTPFVAAEIQADGMDALRDAADKLRDRLKSVAGILGAKTGAKAAFVAFVTDDLVESKGLRADVLVREVAKIAGGGGGGRPQLATAGGKQPEKVGEAIASAKDIVEAQLAQKAN